MNNILTLFHGYVGMMLETEKLDPALRVSLGKIRDGACAATELMDRTYALVRRPKLVPRELDLPFFLGVLHPAFQALCGPQTSLEMEVPAGLQRIWADAGQIKAALLELVRNACDATAETGGKVRVQVSLEPSPGEGRLAEQDSHDVVSWISLLVIDDGPGISAHTAARMFEPFYTTRKQKQASGLGLNVAAEAVQSLGGILSHSSRPGETRFAILLPVQSAQDATVPQVERLGAR